MKKFIQLSLLFMPIFVGSSFLLCDEPSFKGNTGIFHLFYASSLEKGKLQGGIFADNIDRENRDTDVNNYSFTLGYGLTDKLELGFYLSYLRRIDVDDFQTPYFNDYPFAEKSFQQGFGDAEFGVKYQILGEKYSKSGLAVRGFFSLPLANREKGTTTTKPSAGGTLIFSQELGKLVATVNVGYLYRSSPEGIELSNEFNYGAGLEIPLYSNLKVIAEIYGISYTNGSEQKNPLDLTLGLTYRFANGINIGFAYRKNLLFSDGMATSQGGFGYISWSPEKVKPLPPAPPPPPPKEELPPPPPPPPPPPAVEIKFEDVYFPFDSYELTPSAIQTIENALKVFEAYPEIVVRIEGHACNIGTVEYNLALGEHRALAVKEYLVSKKGVKEVKLSTISFGESKPKFDNSKEETRRFNRRAEFKVTKEKE